MNYALLIGTKNSKREIITDGSPVEVRRLFKEVTAKDGFDMVEVMQKDSGVTRHRRFAKVAAKKAAKKSAGK
tara:strand:+ start:201 stop:416 length:216 start_codon:yes stop_codon:yes gene_type:complete